VDRLDTLTPVRFVPVGNLAFAVAEEPVPYSTGPMRTSEKVCPDRYAVARSVDDSELKTARRASPSSVRARRCRR